jgi:hypothetical protein
MQLGEVYEVFAKQIFQSDMYGFIEVENYIFNKDKQLVVNPCDCLQSHSKNIVLTHKFVNKTTLAFS